MAQSEVTPHLNLSQQTNSKLDAESEKKEYVPFDPLKESEYDFHVGVSADRNHRCRRTMEDAHCFFHDFGGIKNQGFFAIYDGHAGKSAADYCGENLHKILDKLIKNEPTIDISEAFNQTYLLSDRQLYDENSLAGCTAVTALVRWESSDPNNNATIEKKRILYCANAGDARAVLCRNGKAIRLTYDHKGSDSLETDRIKSAGGFVMNNRVNGILAVTRALGDVNFKGYVIGNPYTAKVEITKEDSFLILACDGLWDVCNDQTAVDLISDIEDTQEASKKLLDFALNNFSADNISTMVVRFDH